LFSLQLKILGGNMKTPKPITGKTRLAFVLGCPVEHSLSPAMHNAAFQRLGLDCTYGALEVTAERMGAAVEMVRSESVLGANVTVPHKEAVMKYLDKVEPEALWLHSVNTLFKKNGKLCGTSTDGPGFLRSLGSHARRMKGANVLLVGAGGGARSVGGALAGAGARRVMVIDLSEKRVVDLTGMLKARRKGLEALGITREDAEKSLGDFSFIIQATPVGLHKGDPSPLDLGKARQGALAFDLIYNRPTEFLQTARRKGLVTLDGLGMLLHQGALSFEYWTGKKAPIAVMQKALNGALGRR
jgi:shikimate dehydrogenase